MAHSNMGTVGRRVASIAVIKLCAMWVTGLQLTTVLAETTTENATRHFTFRLCKSRPVVTVNGELPGPKLVVREGDRVIVQVINHVTNNVTIHWHGVRQLNSGWYDGPAYVAQCPIQSGHTFVYNFIVTGQRGTLLYHAHDSWLRASVHGAIIIRPKHNQSYPFPKPDKEVPIVFGEWWNADPEDVIREALRTGGAPNVSDAYTINGRPGLLYHCSENDTFRLIVVPGKTYLLRLINAAPNEDLFFSIANHTVTVVETDAVYVKPFNAESLILTPGQTMNVLPKAKNLSSNATFLMATRPFVSRPGRFDNPTAVGILQYKIKIGKRLISPSFPSLSASNITLPVNLPALNSTNTVTNFNTNLRSLASSRFLANVPLTVDRRFFFVVGLGTTPCPRNRTCQGPNGSIMVAGSVNNVSLVLPATAMLQAHFFQRPAGVFTTDFPNQPLFPLNYTGTPPNNTMVTRSAPESKRACEVCKEVVIPSYEPRGTVVVLSFNARVEMVLQGNSFLGSESHPFHLHGFKFFVVGQGFGNYDANKDPLNFNLVDPVERNAFAVPAWGWIAIRFLADNPGVWFMHCHLEIHTSWELKMAWVVMDGEQPNQKLPPPPADLPMC